MCRNFIAKLKQLKIKVMEAINEIRSYFSSNYGHVSLDQLTDGFILEFMSQGYLELFSFSGKMDLLYDYILSQGLCDVVE
jgi:hypothetical protein